MMEAHLILATIAQRFRLELDPEQEVEINPLITLSPKYGLKMRVVKREMPTIAEEGLQTYPEMTAVPA
jgi:cytochrome P450